MASSASRSPSPLVPPGRRSPCSSRWTSRWREPSGLGPEVGAVFADLHREHDVDLRLGAQVTGFDGDGRRARLTVAGSPDVDADLLVVGIGARSDVALAEAAGLSVDDGIAVDARMRTSHPDVFAAGDVPGRVFRAYRVAGGTVVAAMHINDWDASESLRAAVGRQVAELV